MQIGALLTRHARYRPDHVALVFEGTRLTFGELDRSVNRLANALLGAGLPPGEVGEITGRGPILMPGYHGRPDLTAAAIRDGWLHTGDLGYVDEDGFLYLVDRQKDLIISGGVNVYPRDIEEVLVQHPEVREAAVFGVPDPKWGETPVAAVMLHDGAQSNADALRAWLNARVDARYQRVAALQIHADFPRNVAGKTLKRELRATWTETTTE